MHQLSRAAVRTIVTQQVGFRVNLCDGALYTVNRITPRIGCTVGTNLYSCIVDLSWFEGDTLSSLHAVFNHHALHVTGIAGLWRVFYHIRIEIFGSLYSQVGTGADT